LSSPPYVGGYGSEFQGLEEALGFGQGFVVFGMGTGVGDDTGADVEPCLVRFAYSGANGDA
jgi:hypothetical protein